MDKERGDMAKASKSVKAAGKAATIRSKLALRAIKGGKAAVSSKPAGKAPVFKPVAAKSRGSSRRASSRSRSSRRRRWPTTCR